MKDEEKTKAQLLREVTQLREHIRALEESESERRFRGAFEYAAFGMALLVEQGRFIEVNCSLCEMFGYSQEDLLTKTFKDITYPQDLPVGSELFQDLRSGKRNFGWLEKRYVHKNGHIMRIKC